MSNITLLEVFPDFFFAKFSSTIFTIAINTTGACCIFLVLTGLLSTYQKSALVIYLGGFFFAKFS